MTRTRTQICSSRHEKATPVTSDPEISHRQRTAPLAADPEISHYANLHEIRAHLRYHDHLQQAYRAAPAGASYPPLRASPNAPVAVSHDAQMIEARAEPRSAIPPPGSHPHHYSDPRAEPRSAIPPPGSHPHHYSDPRVQHPARGQALATQRGLNSAPSGVEALLSQKHLYSRSADARMWEEQVYAYGRSLTPGPAIRSQTPNPSAQPSRAHTPVNEAAYVSSGIVLKDGAALQRPGMEAKTFVSVADNRQHGQRDVTGTRRTFTHTHPDYESQHRRDVVPGNLHAPHAPLPPPQSHSYGSLPRQRDLQEKRYYSHGNLQPSLMSSSAQV